MSSDTSTEQKHQKSDPRTAPRGAHAHGIADALNGHRRDSVYPSHHRICGHHRSSIISLITSHSHDHLHTTRGAYPSPPFRAPVGLPFNAMVRAAGLSPPLRRPRSPKALHDRVHWFVGWVGTWDGAARRVPVTATSKTCCRDLKLVYLFNMKRTMRPMAMARSGQ